MLSAIEYAYYMDVIYLHMRYSLKQQSITTTVRLLFKIYNLEETVSSRKRAVQYISSKIFGLKVIPLRNEAIINKKIEEI